MNDEEWNEYVQNHKQSTIFHTLPWKKVLETVGYKPNYQDVRRSGRITGILPMVSVKTILKRVNVSLPLFEAAGPIYNEGKDLKELMSKIKKPYLIRSYNKIEGSIVYANTYVLSATKHDILWNEIWKNKNKVRSPIRKAKRKGIVVKPTKTLDYVKELVRKKHERLNTPRLPMKLLEAIMQLPHAYCSMSWLDEKPVSFMISAMHKKKLHVLTLATDPKYREIYTDAVLYEDHIKYGMAKGCETFDLGRSSGSEVSRFKERLGGKAQPLYAIGKGFTPNYYRERIRPIINPAFKILNKTKLSEWVRLRIP